MQKGINLGVPIEEYLAFDAMDASGLLAFRRSPAKYLWDKTHPETPTPAMIFGSALHAYVLEPRKFSVTYSPMPDGDGRTKHIKDAKASILAEGKIPLSVPDFEAIELMGSNVLSHPAAGQMIFDKESLIESSITWHQETVTTPWLKCRPDLLNVKGRYILELKTAASAQPDQFRSVIYNLGYHVSAAMRVHSLLSLGIVDIQNYYLCVVEKTPPYEVVLYDLSGRAIAEGGKEFLMALNVYRSCDRRGIFPGYPEETQAIDLPDWYYRKIEGDTVAQVLLDERSEG